MNESSYHCTICKRAIRYTGRLPELYPFCSPRCRRVDLGVWFRGGYSIDRILTADEALGDSTDEQPPARGA